MVTVEDILKRKDKAMAQHLLAEENSQLEQWWQEVADSLDVYLTYLIEVRKEGIKTW